MERSAVEEQLILAAHRLDALGLVPACDGNLSARASENTLLVTRTQVRKRELNKHDLVEVDLGGRVTGGEGRPTTELGLHLAAYQERPEVQCVVHAHPPVAVGFACAGKGFGDPLMPEAYVHLGTVPVAPYATPGTPELEAAVRPLVQSHNAFLLENHGAVTLGTSVDQALDRMETLEHAARILLTANLLGGGTPLSAEALRALDSLVFP